MARTADPLWNPGHEWVEHLAAQQVPLHSAGQRPRSGDTDRRAASARRDRRARPGAAPAVPATAPTQHRWDRRSAGVDSAVALPAAEPGHTVPQGRSRAATAGGIARSAVPAGRKAVGSAARPGPAGQRHGLHHLRRQHRSFSGSRRRNWYLRSRKSMHGGELFAPDACPETFVTEEDSVTRPPRRRASRAAGPHGGEPGAATVRVETAPKAVKRQNTPLGPPPRRPAHRRRVGWIALAASLVGIVTLAGGVGFEIYQQHQADADHARVQRFVDTATQTVVNMFSYKQDNIDQSVARFVDGTSGPLHGMLSSNNNVENIKALFRHTDANSEAVVNGAALESIDSVSDNASVLVSIRVTVTDLDGVNKPSMPYRMRVIVHEDENGRMTGYDLKYPDGGN